LETANAWSTKKYETIIFQVKFKSDRCSDKTVPYNKCLELTAPTELKITNEEAPAENNCRKIIWDAPPKIITDSM